MTRADPNAAPIALVCPACRQQMRKQRSREVDVWICPCGEHWFSRRALDVWMVRGVKVSQRRVPTLHHPRLWRAVKCDAPRTCPNCAALHLQRYVGEGIDVLVCLRCRGLCVSAPALDTLAAAWKARAHRIEGQGWAVHWASGLFELLFVALRL